MSAIEYEDNPALRIAVEASAALVHEQSRELHALRVALAIAKAQRDEAEDAAETLRQENEDLRWAEQGRFGEAENLRAQVADLQNRVKLPRDLPTITPDALAEIVAFIRNGEKIRAIKAVREAVVIKGMHDAILSGWRLAEAKDFIEALAEALGYDKRCRPKQPAAD